MSDANFSNIPPDQFDNTPSAEQLEHLMSLMEFNTGDEETELEPIEPVESSPELEQQLISLIEFNPSDEETELEPIELVESSPELEQQLISLMELDALIVESDYEDTTESQGIGELVLDEEIMALEESEPTSQDFDTIEAEFLVFADDESGVEISSPMMSDLPASESLPNAIDAIALESDTNVIEDSEEVLGEDIQIAVKLQEQNQQLIQTIIQLEQGLAESQQQLQSQIRRSRSADSLIAQQAQEIDKTQEQITYVVNELEAAQQTTQRQQLVIENLSEQLEVSQQQLAKLERECVLLQESNNLKNQKLIAVEKQVQELQARLLRQQRQTLQYKAALEQSLEISTSQSSKRTGTVIASIQPWSSQSPTPRQSSSLNNNLADEAMTSSSLEVTAKLEAADIVDNMPLSPTANNSRETVQTIAATKSNSPSPLLSNIPPNKKHRSDLKIDLPSFLRPR